MKRNENMKALYFTIILIISLVLIFLGCNKTTKQSISEQNRFKHDKGLTVRIYNSGFEEENLATIKHTMVLLLPVIAKYIMYLNQLRSTRELKCIHLILKIIK